VLYYHSRGANSVNSVTVILKKGMYQLKQFSGPAVFAYSVISKYDPDTSKESAEAQKFMYRQETKDSTQEQ